MNLDRSKKSLWIDTEGYSAKLRRLIVDTEARAVRLTEFGSSKQASDLSVPPNCEGFGRIHHFNSDEGPDWPANPLPILPAAKALGRAGMEKIEAQVFQNAGCNWRCWYCFVPFEDLTGRRGELVSVSRMAEWLEVAEPRPLMVDLTGGQPDLTPEWPVWFLRELDERNIDNVYVWSDDNLSTDYLWRYLSQEDIDYLGSHPRYGRACCLKGYNSSSFSFNTKAEPSGYDYQFELLRRMRDTTNVDFYLYVTFTTTDCENVERDMEVFVDRLQDIAPNLPLRTIPLKVEEWGPVTDRLDDERRASLLLQHVVLGEWEGQIQRRFDSSQRALTVTEQPR